MRRFPALLFGFVLLRLANAALGAEAETSVPSRDGLYAEFITSRGTMVAELFFQRAPLTVGNFVGLAEARLGPAPRKPFFDGVKFHRVVPGFVVQTGDPLGTGEGGPGYEFPDEFAPGLEHDGAGVLSMANSGPNTNGSQFFITLARQSRLNGVHAVFGRIVHGEKVLQRIEAGDTLRRVVIHRHGPAAESFRPDERQFAAWVERARKPRPALFADPDALLPKSARTAKDFEKRLAEAEAASGVRILVRVVKPFSPETPAQRPGNLAGAMARQLGFDDNAVLAVYFADAATWGLWIGGYHVATFMGRPGTVDVFTREGALHEAKQAFLAEVKARADNAAREAAKKSHASEELPGGERIRLEVGALIDALTVKFRPTS